MALFVKQDFSPPLLSPRWFVIKCRPNMLLHCRTHVISILESGLLFREDSVAVEEIVPGSEAQWAAAGGGYTGWLTRGELALVGLTVASCATLLPMRMNMPARSLWLRVGIYIGGGALVRQYHRGLGRGTNLQMLLMLAKEYTVLTRRTMACLKEYSLLIKGLGSVADVSETATSLLRKQQASLALLLSRSCSALLGNMPMLQHDLNWDTVGQVLCEAEDGVDLVRAHHVFLVLQSSTLKTIALAHFLPPPHFCRMYGNQNERLYWLHNKLLPHISAEYKENCLALDRVYRLLKNYNFRDPMMNTVRQRGLKINSSWMYSDVHAMIARAGIELRNSLDKCVALDTFLDTCSANDKEIDFNLMNADLDGLIDEMLGALKSIQISQLRLKKLHYKLEPKEPDLDSAEPEVESSDVLTVDTEPEAKDEVYYYVKTEEDESKDEMPKDSTTGPGERERETTKIVLNELRRKLVSMEEVMRHREKIALAKTMPELKDNLPEFPRQINMNQFGTSLSGYLGKLRSKSTKSSHGNKSKIISNKCSLFRAYKIHSYSKRKSNILKNKLISKKLCIVNNKRKNEYVFPMALDVKTNFENGMKSILIKDGVQYRIAKLRPESPDSKPESKTSSVSDGSSYIETSTTHKTSDAVKDKIDDHDGKFNHKSKLNEARKTESEDASGSTSESDSDYAFEKMKIHNLLVGLTKERPKPRNFPARRVTNLQDESMKPVEYNFGTGLAMASVLNLRAKIPATGEEEVFVGDGEVSSDSGNDEQS